MSDDLEIYRSLAQEDEVKNLYRFFEKFEEERARLREQREKFIKEKIALESEILELKKELNHKRDELKKLENAKELIDYSENEEIDISLPQHLQEVEVSLHGEKIVARPTKKIYSYKSVKKLSESVLNINKEANHKYEDIVKLKARILDLELENAKLSVENRDLIAENNRLSRYEDTGFSS